MMDAKKYLKSFETEESLLQLKIRQLQGIQNRLKSLTTPMGKEVVSHTPNVGTMSETVALLIDMQQEIDLLTMAIMQRKREA